MSGHRAHVDRLEFALADVERGGDGDDVDIIAKLSGDAPLPEGGEIVTRFGDIVTVRLRRGAVRRFAESDAVELVEAVRPLHQSERLLEEEAGPMAGAYTRRPPGVTSTGRGSVVAVLDWGVDFAFESLLTRDPDGRPRSRFLGIWDQREAEDRPRNRWGYGRIFSRAEIDAALAADDPYAALEYHPSSSDARHPRSGRWQGAHGTHVIDIAAGNGNGGGMSGVAPEADLLFCHLSRTTRVIGPGTLGDSATVLHALDWVFEMAGDRPVVVNMSVGAHGGPHDGSTLVEQGIDRAVELAPGRVVVNSAGNYYAKAAHASGRVEPDRDHTLRFYVPGSDPTPSELELWHAPVDTLVATLDGPGSIVARHIRFGERVALEHDGEIYAHASYGPRNNGDAALTIVFAPAAPEGVWTLSLTPGEIVDGRFHAWIERDSGLQPRFLGSSVDRSFTTGTICNGRNSITVGAIDPAHRALSLGRFSSAGPTRDGRIKPELVAPGVRISAAQSSPPRALPRPRFVLKSGTSMAAPHVAGTIALMHESLGQRVGISDIRPILFSSLARADLASEYGEACDLHRVGYGVLDIVAAERAAHAWRAQRTQPGVKQMDERLDNPAATPTVSADYGWATDNEQLDETWTEDAATGIAEASGVDATPEDAQGQPRDVTANLRPEWLVDDDQETGEDDMTVSDVEWPWDQAIPGEGGDDQIGEALTWSQPAAPELPQLTQLLGGAFDSTAAPLVPMGASRAFLEACVQQGDVIRTAHSGSVAVVTGEEAETAESLWRRGVPVAWSGSGTYVELAERTGNDGLQIVGRRLTDASGRLARGTSLWRVDEGVEDARGVPAEQADPWCASRAAIARIALQEERDWTRPDGRKRVESEAGRLAALVRYWTATPGFQAPADAQRAARLSAADDRRFPWSAAFICFVMRSAGITAADGFEFGGAHIRYIVGALRNRERSDRTRPFWLVDSIELVNEVRLAPGDLICFNRRVLRNGRRVWTRHSYDSLRRQFWLHGNQNRRPRGSSHTSLVVGTEQRNGRDFVRTVGGNEGNSVRLQRIPINAGGGIDNPTARRIFGAIKITRC